MSRFFVLFIIVMLVIGVGCVGSDSGSDSGGTHLSVVGNYSNGQVLVRVSFSANQNGDALELIMEWADAHGCRVVSVNGASYNQQYGYYAVLDCGGVSYG